MLILMPDPPEEPPLNEYLGLLPDIDGPLFGLRAIGSDDVYVQYQGNMVLLLMIALLGICLNWIGLTWPWAIERRNYAKLLVRLLPSFLWCNLSPAGVFIPDADKDSALGDDTH